MMEQCRAEAAANWHVDISNPEWLENADLDLSDLRERSSLFVEVVIYLALQGFQQRIVQTIMEGADDPSLSAQDLAEQVCGIGIEALEVVGESAKLHSLQQIRREVERHPRGNEKSLRIAKDRVAKQLAGHLRRQISLRPHWRLARALDEISDQERSKALLRELYVEAPTIWDEHHNTDFGLRVTRGEVVKKIERYLPPADFLEVELTEESEPPEETELAAFAAEARWQTLLKQSKEAGLTPRERELFALVANDPERFLKNDKLDYSEVAQAMGVAEGSIKSWWSRIRNTLAV